MPAAETIASGQQIGRYAGGFQGDVQRHVGKFRYDGTQERFELAASIITHAPDGICILPLQPFGSSSESGSADIAAD